MSYKMEITQLLNEGKVAMEHQRDVLAVTQALEVLGVAHTTTFRPGVVLSYVIRLTDVSDEEKVMEELDHYPQQMEVMIETQDEPSMLKGVSVEAPVDQMNPAQKEPGELIGVSSEYPTQGVVRFGAEVTREVDFGSITRIDDGRSDKTEAGSVFHHAKTNTLYEVLGLAVPVVTNPGEPERPVVIKARLSEEPGQAIYLSDNGDTFGTLASDDQLVIYREIGKNDVWARPVDMWNEYIKLDETPWGGEYEGLRFRRVVR